MNDRTTDVKKTKEVEKIQEVIGRLLAVNPKRTEVTLTAQQYTDYCSAIKGENYKGNPYYHGIELKKRGAK